MDATYREIFEFVKLFNDNVGYISVKERDKLRTFNTGEFYLLLEMLREIDRNE